MRMIWKAVIKGVLCKVIRGGWFAITHEINAINRKIICDTLTLLSLEESSGFMNNLRVQWTNSGPNLNCNHSTQPHGTVLCHTCCFASVTMMYAPYQVGRAGYNEVCDDKDHCFRQNVICVGVLN